MYEIDEKTKQKIIGIIGVVIPEAKIYLFGSRAQKTHSQYSDIDLALDGGKKLPIEDVDELKTMFQNSNIIYKIDIVDLFNTSSLMQDEILKHKVIWKN